MQDHGGAYIMLLANDEHPTHDIYYIGSQLLALLDRFETRE